MQKAEAVENSIYISNPINQISSSHHQCKSCLEDINFQTYTMPCKCFICGDCCFQYLLVQIDHIDFYIDKDIKCPNDHCKKLFKVSQFREHTINQKSYQIPNIQQLDDKLLIKHLQNDPLARSCSNTKCNYYGLLPDYTQICKDEKLQCELCKTEWSDAILQNKSQTFVQKIRKIIFQKNELFSEVHKKIMAKRCPRCAIPITKYGGCYHMICKKCNFEFCWYCCQQYQTHSIYKCGLYIAIGNIAYFISAILFIYLTGFYKYIFKLVIALIAFILSAIMQNILLLLFYLFASFFKEVIKISNQIRSQTNRYYFDKTLQNKKKKNLHLTILIGCIFLLYLSLILYFYYTIYQIFKFIILEIIILSTLYFGYNSMCFIWETWMRYIY